MKYSKFDILNKMRITALGAGRIMCNADFSDLDIQEKTGNNDIVTKYDVLVQETAIDMLRDYFGDDCLFICEEEGSDSCPYIVDKTYDENDKLFFIIDPIDGTSNFSADLKFSAISIACRYNQKIIAGIVYNPFTSMLYHAVEGWGAYCNNQEIKVSEAPIENQMILTDAFGIILPDKKAIIEKIQEYAIKSKGLRVLGSASLEICLVASGQAGMYYTDRLKLWDYAAAMLILQEAGGIVLDLDKKMASAITEAEGLIATTHHLMDAL